MKLQAFAASFAAFTVLATSANAVELVTNGGFDAGLTGWTLFTTEEGRIGSGMDLPGVTSFDVTGLGAENAAQLQVGQTPVGVGQQGGGLRQTITATAGGLIFFADIASLETNMTGNGSAGLFSVLLDGVTLDTFDFGVIGAGVTERGSLSFDTTVTAGDHILEILITRPFRGGGPGGATPRQYVTNVSATQTDGGAVPEPSTWALLILGFAAAGAGLRARRAQAA